MSELAEKKPFAAEYTSPIGSNGINNGNEFERSDAMFAEDVNKIIKNQMYLKEIKADLESPVLTGTPTAPTAENNSNTKQVATTAFTQSAINARVSSEIPTMNGTGAAGQENGKFAREGHVHPKDDSKVDKNNIITAGTKCKISYDAKGLVISGSDLAASDIPNLSTDKLSSGTLPISRGGTGAIDAGTARANIGAAAADHNHNSVYSNINHKHSAGETGAALESHTHKPADVGLSNVANERQYSAANKPSLAEIGAAPASHSHDYAASNHTHSLSSLGAASSSHAHSNYSDIDHTHSAAKIDANGGDIFGNIVTLQELIDKLNSIFLGEMIVPKICAKTFDAKD